MSDLDRLMAEKVMKMVLDKHNLLWWDTGQTKVLYTVVTLHFEQEWPVWQPTLRIEQAMECVKKVLAEHPDWGFHLCWRVQEKNWVAFSTVPISNDYPTRDVKEGFADDHAEAICLALKEVFDERRNSDKSRTETEGRG